MNIAAVLDAFTYLNVQGIGYKGMTLGEIFSNSPCGKDWSCYEAVRTAVANDENLAGMRLVSQSDLHTDIPSSYITACTFVSADGRDYYVAYKGTGDGQWPDDGQGLYQKNTVMQKAAAQYFDEVVDELHLNKEHNIIVTGHSKGGNEAQFVTMAAQHSDLIDSCYSIDGQGFSQKARKSFQEELGDEEYQARRNKMYSINSQNDYVHGLGIVIIPNDTEHTIYLSVPPEVGVGGQHALEHLLYGGRLDLAHPVEAGPLAQFIDVLSAEIMQLSEEDIQDCAMAIMSLIEILNGGSPVGVGDVKSATLEEYCGLISVGIPLQKELLLDALGQNGEDLHRFLGQAFLNKSILLFPGGQSTELNSFATGQQLVDLGNQLGELRDKFHHAFGDNGNTEVHPPGSPLLHRISNIIRDLGEGHLLG